MSQRLKLKEEEQVGRPIRGSAIAPREHPAKVKVGRENPLFHKPTHDTQKSFAVTRMLHYPFSTRMLHYPPLSLLYTY